MKICYSLSGCMQSLPLKCNKATTYLTPYNSVYEVKKIDGNKSHKDTTSEKMPWTCTPGSVILIKTAIQ